MNTTNPINTFNKNTTCSSSINNGCNGSIFDYYTDSSMYVNNVRSNKNIHVENELKGITRCNSSCLHAKYIPSDLNLIERVDKVKVKTDGN